MSTVGLSRFVSIRQIVEGETPDLEASSRMESPELSRVSRRCVDADTV
jgi:hypothetical protein